MRILICLHKSLGWRRWLVTLGEKEVNSHLLSHLFFIYGAFFSSEWPIDKNFSCGIRLHM
jgi:hypothetical protein